MPVLVLIVVAVIREAETVPTTVLGVRATKCAVATVSKVSNASSGVGVAMTITPRLITLHVCAEIAKRATQKSENDEAQKHRYLKPARVSTAIGQLV